VAARAVGGMVGVMVVVASAVEMVVVAMEGAGKAAAERGAGGRAVG